MSCFGCFSTAEGPAIQQAAVPEHQGWALCTNVRAAYAEDTGLLDSLKEVSCHITPGMLFLLGASLNSSPARRRGASAEAHCLVGVSAVHLPVGPLFSGGDALGQCIMVSSPWWPMNRQLLIFPPEGESASRSRFSGSPGDVATSSSAFANVVDALLHAVVQCPRLDVVARALPPDGIGGWSEVRLRAGGVGRALILGATPAQAGGRYGNLVPGQSGFMVGIDAETQVHVTAGYTVKIKGRRRGASKKAQAESLDEDIGCVVLRGVLLHRGHSWLSCLPSGTRQMEDFVLAPWLDAESLSPAPLRALARDGDVSRDDDLGSDDSGSIAGDIDAADERERRAAARIHRAAPHLSVGWRTAAERWWGPERRLYLGLRHLSLLQQGKWGSYISSLAARIQGMWRIFRVRMHKGRARRLKRLQALQTKLVSQGFGAASVVGKDGKLVAISLGPSPFRPPRDAASCPVGWSVEAVSVPSTSLSGDQRTVLLLVPGLTQPDAAITHAWGSLLSVIDTEKVVVLRLQWSGATWLDSALEAAAGESKISLSPRMKTPAAALIGQRGLAVLPDLVASDAFRACWSDSGPVGASTSAMIELLNALSAGDGSRLVRQCVLGDGKGPPLVVIAHGIGARLVHSALASIGGEAAAYGGVDEGVPTCVPQSVVLLGAATAGPEDAGQQWSAASGAVSRALVNVWSRHDLILGRCLCGKGILAPRLGLDILGLQSLPAGARPVAVGVSSAPPGVLLDVDASDLLIKGTIGGHSYANVMNTLIRTSLQTLLPLS